MAARYNPSSGLPYSSRFSTGSEFSFSGHRMQTLNDRLHSSSIALMNRRPISPTTTPPYQPKSYLSSNIYKQSPQQIMCAQNIGNNSPDSKVTQVALCSNTTSGVTEHATGMMTFLYQLWKNQQMCDIFLIPCAIPISSNGVAQSNPPDTLSNAPVPTHRLALAAHSEKFAREFGTKCASPEIPQVKLRNSTMQALNSILVYVYTSKIDINSTNIDATLGCARDLGITRVQELCKDFLLNFSMKSIFSHIQVAEKHRLYDVVSCIQNFLCEHFLELVNESEDYVNYDLKSLCRLLSNDNIAVDGELDIFLAILRWIQHSDDRIQHLPELIQLVRFAHIPPEAIVAGVESVQFVSQMPACKDTLYSAFRYHALKATGSGLANVTPIPPARKIRMTKYLGTGSNTNIPLGLPKPMFRQYIRTEVLDKTDNHCTDKSMQSALSSNACPEVISPGSGTAPGITSTGTSPGSPYQMQRFSFNKNHNLLHPAPRSIVLCGGFNPRNPQLEEVGRLVQEYNPQTNSWYHLTYLPEARHHHGAVVVGRYLYIIGGSSVNLGTPRTGEITDIKSPTDTCFRFAIQERSWERLSPMNYHRMYHAVAVLDGNIYALGGEDEFGRMLNSVEYYNPKTNSWNLVREMADGKIGIGAAEYGGILYVVGGFKLTPKGRTALGTVECYDPKLNSWISKRAIQIPRCHANVVVADGELFLVGGATFTPNESTIVSIPVVHRYDVIKDEWRHLRNLQTARHDSCTVAIGTRLYVLGGITTVSNAILNDVECFDISQDTWITPVENLPYPAIGIAACII